LFIVTFNDFNNWIIKYWPALTIIIVGTIIVILILWFIIPFIVNKKINKKLKKINEDTNISFDKELGLFLESLNLKIITIKYVKNTPNRTLAWKGLIEILTRVVGNTFDEYGNEKDVLDSIHTMFKNIRNYITENVGAINATKVLLIFLNKTLRSFLPKWDQLINKKEIFKTKNESQKYKNYKEEFKNDYNKLIKDITNKRYIQNLCHMCGIKLKNLKKYTDKR